MYHRNKVSVPYRQVKYTVIDEDIAHDYMIGINMDGTYRSGIMGSGFTYDAKDVKPEHTNLIYLVEKQVSRIMDAEGSSNRYGTCHRFWELKKQKLKEQGIDWRSPAERNPSTFFD